MDEELLGFEAEEAEEGVNEQLDEPTAETATQETDEQAEAPEGEPDSAEPVAPDTQDAETNAQFAAARRRAEAEFQTRLQREKDNLIRDTYAGQVNPYTGKPITSEADLNEYKRQFQADQLKQAGLDPNVLQEMIQNDPTVRQAREMTARLQQQEGQQALESEVSAISKLDPSIKTVGDLMNQPNADVFHSYVQKGYSLSDAFRLANFDRLAGKKAAAARQATINSVAGKEHLTTTKGAAGSDVTVTADEMEMFRALNPDASDKEIKAFIAKSRKE